MNMRMFLQARSWLNETVIVPFLPQELALALNMALNLRTLSYDHTLLLSLDQGSCLKAVAAIPDLGALCPACTPAAVLPGTVKVPCTERRGQWLHCLAVTCS